MGLINYHTPMRFGCFLLLAIAAFTCIDLCGAGLKAEQEASQSAATVKPKNDAPGISLCEAILLAEQYLTENHIFMPRNYLQSVELIDAGNIKQWRILWKLNKLVALLENDRTDVPPIEGVYVKMDRTVDPIDRQVISKEEPQQLPTSPPGEAATLQGNLTFAEDGSPMPGVFITMQSSFALWQDVTNENGTFRISRIVPGDYLFKCYLPGFVTLYRMLHLQDGEIRQLDLKQGIVPIIGEDVFDKKPLRGNVYINNKIAFPGVSVTAVAKNFSQTVISMENGEFRFFGLEKDGTYTLHFSAEGFPDKIATCVVGPGIRPKTEIHFIIPWLCELPDPASSHLEAQQTITESFDWQAMKKAIGTVFIEKYGKDIIEFERQEIAALIPVEKIDLYMEYFEKGLKTDIGMSIIEGGEYRWLEIAETSGNQYRQVFELGYNKGNLNATLGSEVEWKVEWRTFIKEWRKFLVQFERSKADALIPRKKIDDYMEYFDLGLYSDNGISKKKKKVHSLYVAAFRYGFHFKGLFENGYREGLVQSAGDLKKYMKRID